MALIAGFPNLAAAAKPTAADLNSAVTKIMEQIGGVDGDGTHHAGNLEAANHVAAPGFRNAQKLEARSAFMATLSLLAAYAGAQRRIGPFPYAARLEGVALSADLPAGTTLTKAGITLTIGTQVVTLPASAGMSWTVDVLIPAGVVLLVEPLEVTYGAGGPATELRAAVWFSMEHRS
jgi:hypothetical protein